MLLRSSGRLWAAVAGALLVVAYIGALAWALQTQSYNIWGSMLLVPALVAVNIPLLVAAGRRESDSWFARLILYAFGLKLVGSAARYAVAYLFYDGYADALGYSRFASAWHDMWRAGMVVWEVPDDGVTGTAFIRLVTTALYTVIGPSAIGGFLVFASFAFWGTYFMYRAFRIAVPEGDHRRYVLLLFLLPSVLYWPSSIGKEAWLMFWIGIVALGAAKFYARQRGASILLAAGLIGTLMVRPHFAALLVAGLVLGQLLRPRGGQAIDILPKVAGAVLMVAAGWIVAGHSAAFLGIDELSFENVQTEIDTASRNTEQGGSEFEPVPLTSPAGLPASFVTVLFRPFPWEAHNLQVMMSALEGLALLVLFALSWRRLRRLPGLLRSHPYLIFSLGYVLLFVWAFSGFGNFGILTRERVLVFPFLLVFAALPKVPPGPTTGSGKRQETEGAHA